MCCNKNELKMMKAKIRKKGLQLRLFEKYYTRSLL